MNVQVRLFMTFALSGQEVALFDSETDGWNSCTCNMAL